MINKALIEYTSNNIPASIEDISSLIYSAQCVYQQISSKLTFKSNWKQKIQNKIESLMENDRLISKHFMSTTKDEERKKAVDILCSYNYKKSKRGEFERISSTINDQIKILNKKLSVSDSRRQYGIDNRNFELNRRSFYRKLNPNSDNKQIAGFDSSECLKFWGDVWKKRDKTDLGLGVNKRVTGVEDNAPDVSDEFISNLIEYLPNWKAPGCDAVYNFFIKKLDSLHKFLFQEIRNIINGVSQPQGWFYTGITFLIPKKANSVDPKDLRPITCMPCLYKLVTKCVNEKIAVYADTYDLITEFQLGSKRHCQGAKELALLNRRVNEVYGNKLLCAWIDVKKAFDSVSHEFLFEVLENSGLPKWITKFMMSIIPNWRVSLRLGKELLGTVNIDRGILQGDSLSPQLFVLVLDPLSRILSLKYPSMSINTGEDKSLTFSTNHFLFIDDLKLFAQKEETLARMMEDVNIYFKLAGLEKNFEKSATNCYLLRNEATLMDGLDSYRYLGVLEDRCSNVLKEDVLKNIKEEMQKRIGRLSETKLNAVNLFRAINEHALSLINYYIGLLNLEPSCFEEMDKFVRKLLADLKIHMKPACKERLYLPRDTLGRGLVSVAFKAEKMLLDFKTNLERRKLISLRKAAILWAEQKRKTHMATITEFLHCKYGTTTLDEIAKSLRDLQIESLLLSIKKKRLHSKLFESLENNTFDIPTSSTWLKKGNISPKSEAMLSFLQDRNVFFRNSDEKCPHCKSSPKTVDHLATRCSRMLNSDYTRRHNEIVRCVHMHLCRRFGMKKSKRLKNHSVQSIMSNSSAEIRVDTTIPTELKIQYNKPDIFLYDKKENLIWIIEVGVTSIDNLKSVEVEKMHKYDILASELQLIHKAKVKIVPIVLT
ncbi:uncharacterized protein LOC115231718 [Octopus sinensis]|uniref:Uncharacterized protein LOC115231718 n=1 Tax=Octopus sinensis TaxID=2607531 RepID=A0A6P7TYH4_9MOLL|nr:uncharacterized protein LOC115231718 [Octopus sinensis]